MYVYEKRLAQGGCLPFVVEKLKTYTDKLVFLMNHTNMQPVVVSTLVDIFKGENV